MLTAAMAKVAKYEIAGATTLETPVARMAKTGGAAIAAKEVPMFPLTMVGLAETSARAVRPAASVRPTASTASVEAPQREAWRLAEDFATDMVGGGGDSRGTKWRPWPKGVALRGELVGGSL